MKIQFNKRSINLFGLLLFIHLIQKSNSQSIFVFNKPNHKGTPVKVSIAQCSNLPSGIAAKVESVNTQGQCSAFYDGKDCGGSSIEVMARSPSHYNLDHWSFSKKTLSVGPCSDPCANATLPDKKSFDLIIFDRRDYKGAYQELKVPLGSCTLIPAKFVHHFLSVRTYDECLQFYNNGDCKGSGAGVDSIEMRRGTPFHSDVYRWWFFEARAVSHCSFKCDNKTIEEIKNKRGKEKEEFPQKKEEVFLYDDKNFKGNRFELEVDGTCKDVGSEWEGTAMSVKTFKNESCVILYAKRGCQEDNVTITGSEADLAKVEFDGVVRSLQFCKDRGLTKSSLLKGRKGNGGAIAIILIVMGIAIISVFGVILFFKGDLPILGDVRRVGMGRTVLNAL